MRILLIGAQGMLGYQLKKHFEKKGYILSCLDKATLDITCFSSIKAIGQQDKFSYIVNASGYTQVDQAEKEKEKAFRINSEGVKHLCWLANKKKSKLIHFSTDYVFDGCKDLPYKEEDLPCPLNTYGSSKWEGEKQVMHTCENYLIIRLSWLIGHYGKNFISTMINLMKREKQLKIIDDQWGRPTFCEDVANLFPQAFNLCGLYHFANSGVTTWFRFASYLHQLLMLSPQPIQAQRLLPLSSDAYPTLAKRPLKAILDTQKIERDLPCSPLKWEEALENYLNLKQALSL